MEKKLSEEDLFEFGFIVNPDHNWDRDCMWKAQENYGKP